MSRYLSIDLGTSSVKAAIVTSTSEGWQVEATAAEPLPQPSAQGSLLGSSQQDAEMWWNATKLVIGRLATPNDPIAITLSGQMQAVVLIAADGLPLRPAMLYSDTRATCEAEQLEACVGRDRLLKLATNWKGAASTMPKLRWLLANEPALVERCDAICLSAHDFIFRRLTGRAATDPTNASTTGLVRAGSTDAYAEELLAEAGISSGLISKLPPICQGSAATASLSASAADALDGAIAAGTRVCLGSGDLGTTTVGALGVHTGAATYCYLGTSGWVATVRDAADAPQCDAFQVSHPLGGRLILAAPMTTAGGNVRWLCGLLFAGMDETAALAAFEEEAATASAGCNGLLFLPYLRGERCPVSDPHAKACFIGMGPETTRGCMCRAVLEGVCFAVRSLMPLLPADKARYLEHAAAEPTIKAAIKAGAEQHDNLGSGSFAFAEATLEWMLRENLPPLHLVGGVANSRVAAQTLANVLNREVRVPQIGPSHVPALGAAALAAAAMGEPPPHALDAVDSFSPDAELVALYDGVYEQFATLHPALKGIFQAKVQLDGKAKGAASVGYRPLPKLDG